MKNIDKYEKEIKEIIEDKRGVIAIKKGKNEISQCRVMKCSKCLFFNNTAYGNCMGAILGWLLEEYKEQILDEVEKKYLEGVIRPFKDRVISICKWCVDECSKEEFIEIKVIDHRREGFECINEINLPYFELNTMYKGMERKKDYTLKDLGLFEGEKCKE